MNVTSKVDDYGRPIFEVTSDKFKHKIIVKKANNGFVFFNIGVTKGSVPKQLEGSFTTPEKALKAVEDYVKNVRTSQIVERDRKTAKREAEKNAKSIQSDNSEHV